MPLWLRDLRNGNIETRTAFNGGYFGLPTKTGSKYQRHYLAAFWAETEEDLAFMAESISDGLRVFEAEFGFRPITMVPCNYVFPSELELASLPEGIRYLQLQRGYVVPAPRKKSFSIRRPICGRRNRNGQIQGVRNVRFEQFYDGPEEALSRSLRQIENAFRFGTPAIITTHRANYTGKHSEKNRAKGLQCLKDLLSAIVKRWPTAVCLSSDELCLLMEESGN